MREKDKISMKKTIELCVEIEKDKRKRMWIDLVDGRETLLDGEDDYKSKFRNLDGGPENGGSQDLPVWQLEAKEVEMNSRNII